MSTERLELWGFGLNDRSGKVRWLAAELGIEVLERRLKPGEHRKPPYTDMNPYAMVPTAKWRGDTMIESGAILTMLAESYPDARLVVTPGEPARARYLQWRALFAETFESRMVELVLSRYGVLPEALGELIGPPVARRFETMMSQLPAQGFVVAGRFTLVDIYAAYTLRLGISAGLCTREDVGGYLEPLIARPGAQAAGFFSALDRG